jgi:hypothetical protein
MLLKLPASSGKTGAMRAKSGSRSGDLDISGGYETVKCHRACHFPNLRLRCAQERYQQADLHLRSGIAIIPPPRPAFVGGKGSPCEKKKGSLCEEES